MVVKYKDPHARERAAIQKLIRDNGDSDALARLAEAIKGKNGHTPEYGKDYFTAEDIALVVKLVQAEIKPAKPGAPGADAEVNYELIETVIAREVAKRVSEIKPAKPGAPGAPGKDADPVELSTLVDQVLVKLPKNKDYTGAFKSIRKYIDDKVTELAQRQPVRIGGSVASIRALTDVDISSLSTDDQGNYILGSPGSGGGTWVNEVPTGAVDNSNTTFTLVNTPISGSLYFYLNGQFQRPGVDYTLSNKTITMSYTPAGGTVYAMYQK